ncbi:hypothetical protein DSLASN_18000 [Desulfoluna limicola]|uniref:N-acetyltransferase domain-containing protein n=1 Tax=Desulfoluna limicola TaxID=2810562 RepID=A0ABM7PEX5_9BACT|nr:GNAT family protein [Desulfoluna limicola]BCS96168.1 hypothetical protein DSLASN_18000 [Desulfoluna limicola]
MRMNLLKQRVHPLKSLFSTGFSTQRLDVCAFQSDDASEMGAGFDSPDVWRFSTGIDTVETAGLWLAGTLEDPAQAALTVRLRHTRDLVGFLVLSRWRGDRVELGGWLSSFFWNQGFGGELLEELKAGVIDAKGDCSLVAEVDPSNGPAIHLLERVGFVLVDGVWSAM